jgi:phosphoenolpyruvate phosphomutase
MSPTSFPSLTNGQMMTSLLTDNRQLSLVGIHDALSGLIAQSSGARALWASSFGRSATYGLPDLGFVGLSDIRAEAQRLRSRLTIPTVIDCDNVSDSTIAAYHFARSLADIGADAICIEDKAHPKRSSLYPGKQPLRSVREQCRLVSAIVRGVGANGLIVARTDLPATGGDIEDALYRCKAYSDAGATAILLQSTSTSATDVLTFASAWSNRLPLFVVPTTYSPTPHITGCDNIRAIVYANQMLRASVRAMQSQCKLLRDNERQPPGCLASTDEISELVGLSSWTSLGD